MTIQCHWGIKRGPPTSQIRLFSAREGGGKDEQKETGKEKCAHQMFRPESINVAAGLPSGPSQTSIKQTKTLTCALQTNKPAIPLPDAHYLPTYLPRYICIQDGADRLPPGLVRHVRPCTHPAVSMYRLLARLTSGREPPGECTLLGLNTGTVVVLLSWQAALACFTTYIQAAT
ncbi:hypothetical protein LX32DRAFT_454025 [Colletotrichum zoysiae]|uniref:Uncharacterized protein n=1 Tax=Colletotrichum zoysiae TaxID=1216348 RepID=A0AAD9HDZ7_9PEZI|nr:hypothetical protein LX32DRAFT_454025 [Colletotrichum zoysiae]